MRLIFFSELLRVYSFTKLFKPLENTAENYEGVYAQQQVYLRMSFIGWRYLRKS